MQHIDQIYGYSTIILAAAPLGTQLAISDIRWIFFFPIFAIPAITLMMTVGHLSKSSAVQTFRKIAPISAGIGWALTWHCAEKLFAESLRAAQYILYMIFSLRPSYSWAVSCDHKFNTDYCHRIEDWNVSVTEKTHHYPDNFWPAQEFNRYIIRGNPRITKIPEKWEPNMWYLGPSTDQFEWSIPSLPLTTSHLITWTLIYFIITKYSDRMGEILVKVFVVVPVMLYITCVMGLTGFGFHFTTAKVQVELEDTTINSDPYDFWADLRGSFRASILFVDYSTAFTGFVLFATSRLRSGVAGLSALMVVPMMMVVPMIQTLMRLGCEGRVADVNPHYKIYASTDETISFDLLPVCFASTTLGPVWSILYFTAQYLHTSLGPMLIYVSFIYQSFIDDFPTVQNTPKRCIGILCLAFLMPSFFLYMPLGTRIAAFFRYTTQTAIVQMSIFVLIFLVYGWQKIEQDYLMTSQVPTRPSILEYFIRPISPVITVLLFTVVPTLLCAKLVAVFDYLSYGNDVIVHIDAGTQFLPFPLIIRRTFGCLVMFAPVLIMVGGALATVFQMVVRHKLPLSDTIKPSPDWMAHASVNTNKPRPHSLAYSIWNRIFRRISWRSALFILFLFETFLGIILVVLFFLNSSTLLGMGGSRIANSYRSTMLLGFVLLHVWSLFEMRKSQHGPNIDGDKLSPYIAVATMETSMLNAYMWMFGTDHAWGFDAPPLLLMFCNTVIRGTCILASIAIRSYAQNHCRPSNTREASEIGEEVPRGNEDVDEDDEDDSPVIFDLAREP